MTAKHECSEEAYDVTGWHRCFRNATVQHDDQWYCWQHDPRRVRAEAEKRRTAWQAKMDREDAKYARIARNARLAALVDEETAALLRRLANSTFPSEYGVAPDVRQGAKDRKSARELVTKIKEALNA